MLKVYPKDDEEPDVFASRRECREEGPLGGDGMSWNQGKAIGKAQRRGIKAF